MFDTGSTAFMMLAASLVLLMTPGLAFFYAGMVGRKNVSTIMFQSFVSMGITTIIWLVYGYSLCFSGDLKTHTDFLGIIGNLNLAFLSGIKPTDITSTKIPVMVFLAYQMMTAIITPALITGAFTNRVKFPAYLLFLVLWLTLVYFPMVHMVWGGGLLQELWQIQDFAGGIVIHTMAGIAALASVFYVGRRKVADKGLHSLPLVAIGTGMLWFGWFGFNAGGEFAVDNITSLVFLNTTISASFCAMVWMVMDWITFGQPKLLGFATGAVAGLVVITPGCGFVSTQSAAIIGSLAGVVCYLAIHIKNKAQLDDALDVWGVHGVGGTLGIILLGVFGSSVVNPAGADGLIHGGAGFFIKETVTVLCAGAYAIISALIIFWLIDRVTPVVTTEKDEVEGLDRALHGEAAYD